MDETLAPPEAITDFTAACREKAASLNLSEPRLPFDSICMDGKPYIIYKSDEGTPFPSFSDEPEERLEQLGTWRCHQGVLEFVDEQGRYHVARDVEANVAALEKAGFTRTHAFNFFTNGPIPAGESEARFEALMKTPENEAERLSWAARDCNLEQLNYALEHGAKVKAAQEYTNEPLLINAIKCWSENNKEEIIRKLVALEGPFVRDDGGAPAFLLIYPGKRHAREEFRQVTDAMLKTDITEKEKKLIRGHCRVINQAWDAIDKAADPEEKKLREDQTIALCGMLEQAWKEAYRVESKQEEQSTTTLSPWVQNFLEPLVDGKRTPKFLETLSHYNMHKLQTSDDLILEFTQHVVLPLCLLEYSRKQGVPLTDNVLKNLDRKQGFSATGLISKLMPVVRAELFGDRSLDRIIGLSEAWHDGQVAFPDALKPLKTEGEWHSLIGEKVHEVPGLPGITLHALTTYHELVDEGKTMRHCVGDGGAATQCLEGKLHVFSIRKAGIERPLATLGCRWDGKKYERFQNLGPHNAAPAQEALEAENWLKEQLESGAIKPPPKLGETEKSRKTSSHPAILRAIGFEITPGNIHAAFEEFAKNEKRRAREYNPQTETFSTISRNTRLITGDTNIELQDDKGPVTRTNIALRHLHAEMWFAESGLKDRAMAATFQPLIDQEIAEQKAAAESARRTERQSAPVAEDKPGKPSATAANIRWTERIGQRIKAVASLPGSWPRVAKRPDSHESPGRSL